MSEIKISNVDVSYSDLKTAMIYSANIQKSLDKQLELAKELQKNEKEEQEWYRQGPLKKLAVTVMKKFFNIDLTPKLVEEQDKLRQELRKQQAITKKATATIVDTIKKMEYVEYVHLNKAQTPDANIAEKYGIMFPEEFRKKLIHIYDTDYNKAMALNKTPVKTTKEWEMETNNATTQKQKDDVLTFARSLQIKVETRERDEKDGKYTQEFSTQINDETISGDLYNPNDTLKLQRALLTVARDVDIMLNNQYKDLIPQIETLREKAIEAGGLIQISQEGVLSLSYIDENGDERVPYSVNLSEEKDVFFEECMTNIENIEHEMHRDEYENDDPVTLRFESDTPNIATDLDVFEHEDYASDIEDDPLDVSQDYLYDMDDYDMDMDM